MRYNLSQRKIDLWQQYELNIYGKGLCDLPLATSKICDKSQEFLGLIMNSQTMTIPLPAEKIGSMSEVVDGNRGTTSGFGKTNSNPFFTHSSSAPSPSTVSFQTTTAKCICESYLIFVKLIPMVNGLLWWVNKLKLYNDRLVKQSIQ